MSRINVIIVAHTHWDREWYKPFQVFRYHLVALIDHLLDLLVADSAFAHFTLDGQAIILAACRRGSYRPYFLAFWRHEWDGGTRLWVEKPVHVGPLSICYVLSDRLLVSGPRTDQAKFRMPELPPNLTCRLLDEDGSPIPLAPGEWKAQLLTEWTLDAANMVGLLEQMKQGGLLSRAIHDGWRQLHDNEKENLPAGNSSGIHADLDLILAELAEIGESNMLAVFRFVADLYHLLDEIETTVDNRVEDHRLRLLFPTPFHTEQALVEGQFDVVARPIAVSADTVGYVEKPAMTAPQHAFVAVQDGKYGFLVANRGLPTYEIIPGDVGATIALTLLCCVGWLSHDDLPCRPGHAELGLRTPGTQCLGFHTFAYSLIPFADELTDAIHLAYAFRAVVTRVGEGHLPHRLSFIKLESATLVVSAVNLLTTAAGGSCASGIQVIGQPQLG